MNLTILKNESLYHKPVLIVKSKVHRIYKFRIGNVALSMLFALLATCCIAQKSYIPSYNKTRQAPPWINNDPKKLAEFLTRGVPSDSLQAVAIAAWIGKKIRYDSDGYFKGRIKSFSSKKVLKKRKALCGEYAELYREMLEYRGIKSLVVPGYIHHIEHFPGDTLYRAEHAWNVANINGVWKLFDLTYSSGVLEPKPQLVRRFLYRVFKIPFRQKYVYRRRANPFYCFTPPKEFRKTHLPLVPTFQLEKPINMKSFISYNTDSGKTWNDTGIKLTPSRYYNSDRLEQWKLSSYYAQKYWPVNHRGSAYFDYLQLDSLASKYYDENLNRLLVSEDLNQQLKNKTKIADSNLAMALLDNKKEYEFYVGRSKRWKTELHSGNDYFYNVSKESRWSIRKNSSLLRRRNAKVKSYKRVAKNKLKRIKLSSFTRTRRPNEKQRENLALADSLILYARSCFNSASEDITHKDSLLELIDSDFLNPLFDIEYGLMENRRSLMKYMSALYKYKDFWRPDYYSYPVNEMVYKTKFRGKLDRLHHIQVSKSDSLIALYYNVITNSYKAIKAFDKNSKAGFNCIKKAKKLRIEDRGETHFYSQQLNSFKNELIRYSNQLTVSRNDKSLDKMMKKSNKYLQKVQVYLKKEKINESSRHRRYQSLRKRKLNNYNNLIKHLKKELEVILKLTLKTEQEILKSKQASIPSN